MSGINSSQHSSEATDSRQAQPQAGGLLHGEHNEGAERLVKPGGALGGETQPLNTGSQGATPGDASASGGRAGAPAEAGRDASGQVQRASRDESGQDSHRDDTEDVSEGTKKKGEEKLPAGPVQSEAVTKMLAEAERKVKEDGMTDHPETEPRNRKIQEQEEAEKHKAGGEEEAHKKAGLVEKVKGIVHHKS